MVYLVVLIALTLIFIAAKIAQIETFLKGDAVYCRERATERHGEVLKALKLTYERLNWSYYFEKELSFRDQRRKEILRANEIAGLPTSEFQVRLDGSTTNDYSRDLFELRESLIDIQVSLKEIAKQGRLR